jgi:hypothetical protein
LLKKQLLINKYKIEINIFLFMKIKYINMENSTTILIHREHDKVCILETYLNNDKKLETLVSNFIDYSIQKQTNKSTEIFNELKNTITNVNIFNTIIELSISIIDEIPYNLTIKINDKTCKYIQYIKGLSLF